MEACHPLLRPSLLQIHHRHLYGLVLLPIILHLTYVELNPVICSLKCKTETSGGIHDRKEVLCGFKKVIYGLVLVRVWSGRYSMVSVMVYIYIYVECVVKCVYINIYKL